MAHGRLGCRTSQFELKEIPPSLRVLNSIVEEELYAEEELAVWVANARTDARDIESTFSDFSELNFKEANNHQSTTMVKNVAVQMSIQMSKRDCLSSV